MFFVSVANYRNPLKRGITYLDTSSTELPVWMGEHEYDSIRQMQGSMTRNAVPQPGAFERANYMKVLSSTRCGRAGLLACPGRLRADYHTRQAFWLTIGWPALQENAFWNSGEFCNVPFTR